tara:strand:- start:1206 stop:1577 length:372 start_codon:yes stop_codon:yes gene_type:complete
MEILLILSILIIFGAIGAVIIFFVKLLLVTKTPREVYQDSKGLIQEARKSGSSLYKNLIQSEGGNLQDIDEELFSIAYNEIVNSKINEGLWIKGLVLAGGDKDKQEVEYIKLRVAQLNKEIKK